MGSTSFYFHPYLIGLSFVLPLDLSFSCTFFYLLRKAQLVFGSMAGIRSIPGYPFLGEQGTGALFALLAVTCWTGRRHFLQVLSRVFRPDPDDEANEPISYRTAVVTLFICLLVLMVFCIKGGMSLWGYAVFIGIYFAIVVGLARMRAELGTTDPLHRLHKSTIHDGCHVRDTTPKAGEFNDTLVDELDEWCRVSHPPDTRSTGVLQARRTNQHQKSDDVHCAHHCQHCWYRIQPHPLPIYNLQDRCCQRDPSKFMRAVREPTTISPGGWSIPSQPTGCQ